MRKPFYSLIFVFCSLTAFADTTSYYVFNSIPKAILSVTPSLRDNALAFNKTTQKYYASGINDSLSIIDILSHDTTKNEQGIFNFRIKGIWYNTSLDLLEAFNADKNNCLSFYTDSEGYFENLDTMSRVSSIQDSKRPIFTIYNPENDIYAYLEPISDLIIEVSPYTGEIEDYITLNLPTQSTHVSDQLLYTENTDYPYALANKKDKVFYLITSEGQVHATAAFPIMDFTPTQYGFANGLFWFFNPANAQWVGYQLLQY